MFFQTVAIVDAANPEDGMANTGSRAHSCQWCYKQYVLKNKLLKHQRAHHYDLLPAFLQEPQPSKKLGHKTNKTAEPSKSGSANNSHGIEPHAQTVNLQFTGTFFTFTYTRIAFTTVGNGQLRFFELNHSALKVGLR